LSQSSRLTTIEPHEAPPISWRITRRTARYSSLPHLIQIPDSAFTALVLALVTLASNIVASTQAVWIPADFSVATCPVLLCIDSDPATPVPGPEARVGRRYMLRIVILKMKSVKRGPSVRAKTYKPDGYHPP
jgi:hypothetical protein